MTATSIIRGTYAECVDCHGSGGHPTGVVEYETGHHQTVDCSMCGGDGTVDAEWVQTCEGCKSDFWAGTGCTHHGIHCDDCKPTNCTDCTDDQRALTLAAHYEAAGEGLAALRTLVDRETGRIDNWSSR